MENTTYTAVANVTKGTQLVTGSGPVEVVKVHRMPNGDYAITTAGSVLPIYVDPNCDLEVVA